MNPEEMQEYLNDLDPDGIKDFIEHTPGLKKVRDQIVTAAITKYKENHAEETADKTEETTEAVTKKYELREKAIEFCFKSGFDDDARSLAMDTIKDDTDLETIMDKLQKINGLYQSGVMAERDRNIKKFGRGVEDSFGPTRESFTEAEIESMSPDEYEANRSAIFQHYYNK